MAPTGRVALDVRLNLPLTGLRRLLLAAALVAALAAVVSWLIGQPPFWGVGDDAYAGLNPDYEGQIDVLTSGEGAFSPRYPPGFPFLLFGVYRFGTALGLPLGLCFAVFVLACTVTTAGAMLLMARTIWGNRAAFVVAALWAIHPMNLWLMSYPSPETPFVAVLWIAVLLAWRMGQSPRPTLPAALLAGSVIGVANLIRPIALALGLLSAIWILMAFAGRFRRRLLLAGVLLAGNLLVVAPWEIWVYQRTGKLIPLSTAGIPAMLDGLTYAVDPGEQRRTYVPADVRALQTEMVKLQYRELNSVGSIASYLAREFRQRPAAVVKLFAIKAANAWYATDSSRYDKYTFVPQMFYLAFLLAATVKGIRAGGDRRRLAILLWSITLYFWFMTTMSLSIVRYMVPALSLLTLLFGNLLSGTAVRAWGSAIFPDQKVHKLSNCH